MYCFEEDWGESWANRSRKKGTCGKPGKCKRVEGVGKRGINNRRMNDLLPACNSSLPLDTSREKKYGEGKPPLTYKSAWWKKGDSKVLCSNEKYPRINGGRRGQKKENSLGWKKMQRGI